jgi:hypothetical protein
MTASLSDVREALASGKTKVTRRRVREEDYDDDYDDDDYEDEEPMPRKEKAKVANLVVNAPGYGCCSSWGSWSRC